MSKTTNSGQFRCQRTSSRLADTRFGKKQIPDTWLVRRGPRFCDEPLQHGEYFNASPFWKEQEYGRRDAWQSISSGDEVLLYCSGSIDEHGSCLSHLLTVGNVSVDESDGARLEFSDLKELDPKIPYAEIQAEIRAGRFTEAMNRCGQEGFNIAQAAEPDLARVLELAELRDPDETPSQSHPDESLERIADEYFGK